MTIDVLMGLPIEDLEKLTTADYERIFEPHLNVTRPERQTRIDGKVRQHAATDHRPVAAQKNPEGYAKARQYMLDNMGIDIEDV